MKSKILLGMLPYWTPLVPPQGIGMLKSFLKKDGHDVVTFDLNVNDEFSGLYQNYFKIIADCVFSENRANFFNIGHDVLHNHMMAHIKKNVETKYAALVKELLYHTFYIQADERIIVLLNKIMDEFYIKLEEYCVEIINKEQPDYLGLSVFKGNIPAAIFFARAAKKCSPSLKIVMGGGAFSDSHAIGSPNFEALKEETDDCVDLFIVAAQGEKILKQYIDGKVPIQKVATMNNCSLEPLPFEEMGIADLTDFDMDKYPYVIATGSVSCPNQCSFCNVSQFYGKYKKKDVRQTVDEMRKLHDQYGKQVFFMSDSLLNPIVTDLAKELISHKLPFYYDCYFRVDKASGDLDNTILWRRGGLYRTRIGVESGSQKILDLMHKNITVEQTKESLYGLASAGVKTTAYFVIGHPEETQEDFQMTLDLLEEMKDYIWQAEPNPFYYHYTGQADSANWSANRKLLYPAYMKDMLVFDTWTLDLYPLREERYARLRQFASHCDRLGIMNPYTAIELHKADMRWKKIHKNAVPSIWEFESRGRLVSESFEVGKVNSALNKLTGGADFNF